MVAGLADGQGPGLPDQPRQVRALDIFHDQQMRAADLIGVDGVDDVGMVQRGGGPDLAVKAPHRSRVGQAIGLDHLERDDLAQLPVAGLEDLAHAPFPQPFQQHVVTKQEFLAPLLQELIDLIGGEPTAAEQLAGQRLRVGKA